MTVREKGGVDGGFPGTRIFNPENADVWATKYTDGWTVYGCGEGGMGVLAVGLTEDEARERIGV